MASMRWVWHHVFEGVGPVVAGGPAFQGEAFRPADVYAVCVYRVPDRLEDPRVAGRKSGRAHDAVARGGSGPGISQLRCHDTSNLKCCR
jgi:hypothetical protein